MKTLPKLAGFFLVAYVFQTHLQAQHAFTNLAGWPGGFGNADGIGMDARFTTPSGIAMDSIGNLYVGDYRTLRRLSSGGTVTTWAGSAIQAGSNDGTATDARFNSATHVAFDGKDNLYVADTYNHTVRKVTLSGVVTTLAGSAGQPGAVNGTGNAARFYLPLGVASDTVGNVYVADYGNQIIRKVTPEGVVTTLAGKAGQSGSANGTGSTARFSSPAGVALDNAGNLYVADSGNHTIRKLTTAKVVTTLAGSPGLSGSADGKGNVARFTSPSGLSVDGAGIIYVADLGNHIIRRVSTTGVVTTLAGSPGQVGTADGTNTAARFSEPTDLCVDGAGNLYIADRGNGAIRKVSPDGMVTTVAGSPTQFGGIDAMGNAARFSGPRDVAVGTDGIVYVADSGNHTIRKVEPGGRVTTLAGSPGQYGSTDGTGSTARFSNPSGIAVDTTGSVYVADSNNQTIRKVSSSGVVTTLAGDPGQGGTADGSGATARFNGPSDVTVDDVGNLYVADSRSHTIRKVTALGMVTTLAGSPGLIGSVDGTGNEARFNEPSGVAVDGAGNVYVADTGNQTIRKITPAFMVTTLAGNPGQRGSSDGKGSAANFDLPFSLAVDGEGNLYVADSFNHTIRKVTPDGMVTTTAGRAGVIGGADGIGSAAQFTEPHSIAADNSGNLYVADNNRITVGTATVVLTPYLTVAGVGSEGWKMILSGIRPGAQVVWESSSNLNDWLPIQTNVVSGQSLDFTRSINLGRRSEFIRALLK